MKKTLGLSVMSVSCRDRMGLGLELIGMTNRVADMMGLTMVSGIFRLNVPLPVHL